jgi:hypothetical protein
MKDNSQISQHYSLHNPLKTDASTALLKVYQRKCKLVKSMHKAFEMVQMNVCQVGVHR